mgnify:CR=1 FL=1
MSGFRDFLVEIGTEELPPKSLLNLSTAFADGVAKGLKDAGITCKSLERFATPRRLAVRVRWLAEQQPDRPLEKRGPPVKAAFDASGAPTQAAIAFARGCGVEVSALEKLETPKGEWLVHRGTEAGARTTALLPGIVTAALDALPIAKRMRWGAGEAQFVRPVHWVVMLFGRDVIDTEILGLKPGDFRVQEEGRALEVTGATFYSNRRFLDAAGFFAAFPTAAFFLFIVRLLSRLARTFCPPTCGAVTPS